MIFITGATGLLGTGLTSRLLADSDSRIFVLVRALSSEEAARRLKSFWAEDRMLCGATILPQSLGLPPILTIMALARRISKLIMA